MQCRARIFISYDKFSESIYLYQNNEDHTCSEIISTSNRLTKELKNKITSMYEERQKPKQIYEKLKGEGNVLKQTQVYNAIQRIKREKYGPTKI